MRFVDASVFIYTLTRSPRGDYEVSRGILERIEGGEEAITSTAILQEVVDWLEYNGRRREIRAFLKAVNSYPNLHKAAASWGDMLSALDDMEEEGSDYVDSLTLQVMRRHHVEEIYSNDRDFDRVAWVRRIWK